MRKALAFIALILLALGVRLLAHPVTPWVGEIVYLKDERTKACFALHEAPHYGPYFSYVPCELVDKADWHYYDKRAERER